MNAREIAIRRIQAEDTRPLRQEVLRPGPIEASVYPGDDEKSTFHVGAHRGDLILATASVYREQRRGGPAPGWRIRGMATRGDDRGQGMGSRLLAMCIEYVGGAGGGELWCNARVTAVGFYGRAGFGVVGSEFDIPGIGPHRVMTREVASARHPGDAGRSTGKGG